MPAVLPIDPDVHTEPSDITKTEELSVASAIAMRTSDAVSIRSNFMPSFAPHIPAAIHVPLTPRAPREVVGLPHDHTTSAESINNAFELSATRSVTVAPPVAMARVVTAAVVRRLRAA